MPRFLAFDPESHFEPFLIKNDLKALFDIQVISTKDPPAFRSKLKEEYDAVIFFEKGHFSEALMLLKEVKQHPIIFFVTEHRTASSFKKLKVELGVDFVLQTPLLKDEIGALLRRLQEKEATQEEALPPELLEKYKASIFDKISRIEELCKAALNNHDSLRELRTEVHKIAGSASSYGYPDASTACKIHELVLMDALEAKEVADSVYKKNAALLRKLRLFFQHISPKIETKTYAAKEKKAEEASLSNAMMLVSSDLPLVQTFQSLAGKFHVPLVVESSPRKLQLEYQDKPIEARAVIVEEYYPFTAVTGIQMIDSLRIHAKDGVKFGIISNTEDVAKRIEWTESGVDWVLKKPITENNILQVFQQMESQLFFPNTRALIVDDDEDVGMIEKEILASMGMEVVFLSDERNLLKTLEEFAPHLLLLDINLPHFNGQRLLEMLRADMRFQRMIIVIVTAFKQDILEDQVYQKKCDSIIYKPIDANYLRSRIGNLIARRMAVGMRTVVDPTTSLYEKQFFLKRVTGRLPHLRDGKGAFVLLEVDLWEQVSQTLSAIEKKQMVILVANAIKRNFAGNSIFGFLEKARFALFFEGSSGGEVEFLMESFLTEMRKTLWLSGREDLRFTMSIGIVLFGSENSHIEEIQEKADETLKKAQAAGGKQVMVQRLSGHAAVATETRRVILVDDDVELAEVVAYMFRNQGIHVDVFHTGAEAVDFFAKLEHVDRNVLFILDRMLPDRDGLTLLRMIKEKFPGRVKAIFLTSLSSEKDVLEGLQMGAVDYVTKPFSVSVLLQKALALLNR